MFSRYSGGGGRGVAHYRLTALSITTEVFCRPDEISLPPPLSLSPSLSPPLPLCLQVFVANPSKTRPIFDILHRNKERLIDFLSKFHSDRTGAGALQEGRKELSPGIQLCAVFALPMYPLLTITLPPSPQSPPPPPHMSSLLPLPPGPHPCPSLLPLTPAVPALSFVDDDQFNEEKMYLIRQIRELNPDTYREPVATPSASGVAKA